jgi:hypothetical protein
VKVAQDKPLVVFLMAPLRPSQAVGRNLPDPKPATEYPPGPSDCPSFGNRRY